MALERLKISHLRNIRQANLAFCPGLNVIVGANASGKTSLLESIALLIQGRSFRTPRINLLIRHGNPMLHVVGTIRGAGREHTLGMARERNKTQVKLNGKTITRSTELIDLTSLHVVTPESHEILDQGPKMRRQYLDWGVFHVKPTYLACWQRYHRILRQRNHVLRTRESAAAVQAWDKPLVAEAESLHQMRVAYLAQLTPALTRYAKILLETDVEYAYRPGWPQETSDLARTLSAHLSRDRERGFTQFGPHRADITVTSAGRPVEQVLSRGQRKLVICAMYLAQVVNSKYPGLLLIDDLPAELDSMRRERLINVVAETGAQLFVTATERNLIPMIGWDQKKVFHVEHGEFSEVI